MNQENIGLDKTVLEKFAAGGTVEFENYLPRSKSGMRTWELKIKEADGSRRIVVIRDSGLNITGTDVAVQPFTNRAGAMQKFAGFIMNVICRKCFWPICLISASLLFR